MTTTVASTFTTATTTTGKNPFNIASGLIRANYGLVIVASECIPYFTCQVRNVKRAHVWFRFPILAVCEADKVPLNLGGNQVNVEGVDDEELDNLLSEDGLSVKPDGPLTIRFVSCNAIRELLPITHFLLQPSF